MREYFRPYSLVVTLSDTNASSITLVDTAGSALKCNYISVECSATTTDEYFRASINPTGLTTPLGTTIAASSTMGLVTSAGVSQYASLSDKSIVEFLLSDADRSSLIELQLSENSVVGNFYITYGQIQTGNPLRDGERPIGN